MAKAKKAEAHEPPAPPAEVSKRAKSQASPGQPTLTQLHRTLLEMATRQVAASASAAIAEVMHALARPLRARVALYEDRENGGYTAVLTALPGCDTEGKTREEALANLREALEGHLLSTSGTFELREGGVV